MRRDAEGCVYFVGRTTDSIRRRGEDNISAFEVEKAVLRSRGITASAWDREATTSTV